MISPKERKPDTDRKVAKKKSTISVARKNITRIRRIISLISATFSLLGWYIIPIFFVVLVGGWLVILFVAGNAAQDIVKKTEPDTKPPVVAPSAPDTADYGSNVGTKTFNNNAAAAAVIRRYTKNNLPMKENDITINSGMGYRSIKEHGFRRKFHAGTDYGSTNNKKARVYPVYNGKVVFTNWQSGYGNFVIVKHVVKDGNQDFVFYTAYAHLAKSLVNKGDTVNYGTPVGIMGNTGGNYAIHLHFEVRLPWGEPKDWDTNVIQGYGTYKGGILIPYLIDSGYIFGDGTHGTSGIHTNVAAKKTLGIK